MDPTTIARPAGATLTLLGRRTLRVDGIPPESIRISSRRGWALLAYLAMQPGPGGKPRADCRPAVGRSLRHAGAPESAAMPAGAAPGAWRCGGRPVDRRARRGPASSGRLHHRCPG